MLGGVLLDDHSRRSKTHLHWRKQVAGYAVVALALIQALPLHAIPVLTLASAPARAMAATPAQWELYILET